MRARIWVWFMFLVILGSSVRISAIGISLDEISSWGKFPRFCVNTYRWGADFFNGYDTTYVHGTGYPFNIKLKTESWTDYYRFSFENNTTMSMLSDPSTSAGFHLTYLAVSVGYDMNLSKYFTGNSQVRRRWNFGFNCMLFDANLYFISNDVGTRINYFKPAGGEGFNPNQDFSGINNQMWGLDINYFFTHKRYSYGAAFSFNRVQIQSGGSFFAGFSYNRQNYNFDFSKLPPYIHEAFPDGWSDDDYTVNTHNYLIVGGYGYNWCFAHKWMLGAAISPMMGISKGYFRNKYEKSSNFSMIIDTDLSVVYNSGRWFAGIVGNVQSNIVRDRKRSLIGSVLTVQVSAGWRFALW